MTKTWKDLAACEKYGINNDRIPVPRPEKVAEHWREPGHEIKTLIKFTAFCQQADGQGTIWISSLWASDLEAAKNAARYQCAADWGFDYGDVRILGLAEGEVNILEWNDLADDGA